MLACLAFDFISIPPGKHLLSYRKSVQIAYLPSWRQYELMLTRFSAECYIFLPMVTHLC